MTSTEPSATMNRGVESIFGSGSHGQKSWPLHICHQRSQLRYLPPTRMNASRPRVHWSFCGGRSAQTTYRSAPAARSRISAAHLPATMTDRRRWVIDTSAYTHLSRAGHGDLIAQLAPGGVVLLQVQVRDKIGAAPGGRGEHMGHGCFGGSGWGQVGHQGSIRSKKKPRKQ